MNEIKYVYQFEFLKYQEKSIKCFVNIKNKMKSKEKIICYIIILDIFNFIKYETKLNILLSYLNKIILNK